MDTVQMVRLTVGDDWAEEIEAELRQLFDALEKAAPPGLQYLAMRTEDELVLLLHLIDGAPNPLPGIAEAARFRELMARWTTQGPPSPTLAHVLGDHQFLGGVTR